MSDSSDRADATAESTQPSGCELLAFFGAVLKPDPERGITGDFAVFSRRGKFAAIAFPSVRFAANPGSLRDRREQVLELGDFIGVWAVGAYTADGRKVALAWKFSGECVLTDSPDLKVELGLPEDRPAIPLYLPAFNLTAPFETEECQAVALDVSTHHFRACGFARLPHGFRALVWARKADATDRPTGMDISDALTPVVRQHFVGAIGFRADGCIEVRAGSSGSGSVDLIKQ